MVSGLKIWEGCGMLRGFMDHWVPTRKYLNAIWDADIENVIKMIDNLSSEIDFNNFTFYSKWYTNGIKSTLPFLRNDDNCSNVKTDNKWGRYIIDYLHQKGMSVGLMLQMCTFEQEVWDSAPIIGHWGDEIFEFAKIETPIVIADISSEKYISRITDLIKEQLHAFPNVDYLFFEFEGIAAEMIKTLYKKYIDMNHIPMEEPKYSIEVIEHLKALSQPIDIRYSDIALNMFSYYMKRIIERINETLKELKYTGKVGVVYYPLSYEKFFMADIVLDNNWILLPWAYLGGLSEKINKQNAIEILFNHIKCRKSKSQEIIYIGDATISPWDLESIGITMDFCEREEILGYLGMGNPTVELGMRWKNVVDKQIRDVRDLFKKRWNK